jgi:hypothetical protein
MWEVVGRPFRVVPLHKEWLLVGVGDDARRLLQRHGLVGARYRTRRATVAALSGALAAEARLHAAQPTVAASRGR